MCFLTVRYCAKTMKLKIELLYFLHWPEVSSVFPALHCGGQGSFLILVSF